MFYFIFIFFKKTSLREATPTQRPSPLRCASRHPPTPRSGPILAPPLPEPLPYFNKLKELVATQRPPLVSASRHPPTPSGSPGVWYRLFSLCPSCCPPLEVFRESLVPSYLPGQPCKSPWASPFGLSASTWKSALLWDLHFAAQATPK